MTKDELIAKGYEEEALDACGIDHKLAVSLYYQTVKMLRKKGLIKTFIGGGGKELPLNDEDIAIVEKHVPRTKFVRIS